MTDKIKHEFKIEIEKSESGSLIRVTDVNPKSFDDAYVLANNLSRRAAELDIKLLDTERIRKAKDSVAFLWVTKGEGKISLALCTKEVTELPYLCWMPIPMVRLIQQL